MDFLKAIILGLIEGVTEFLPISSTGHLILANQWIAFSEDFTKLFDVIVQCGALLAVVVVYWKRLWPMVGKKFDRSVLSTWSKVIVAVIPAIILGALFGSKIQAALFNPIIVALALIVGGIALVFLEWRRHPQSIKSIEKLSYGSALGIGVTQCLALIPGTSRSAASILGGLFLGTTRQVATEFSFFLAIPTLLAASAYSMLKHDVSITPHEGLVLLVGFVVAFASALAVIRVFLKYIQTKNFLPFAYYRIALGLLMLVFFSLR